MTNLTDFDSHLDALGAAARKATTEVETQLKQATVDGDHRRHALLHRLHRGLHDFATLVAEPRT
jgi:hypothetical protein